MTDYELTANVAHRNGRISAILDTAKAIVFTDTDTDEEKVKALKNLFTFVKPISKRPLNEGLVIDEPEGQDA